MFSPIVSPMYSTFQSAYHDFGQLRTTSVEQPERLKSVALSAFPGNEIAPDNVRCYLLKYECRKRDLFLRARIFQAFRGLSHLLSHLPQSVSLSLITIHLPALVEPSCSILPASLSLRM